MINFYTFCDFSGFDDVDIKQIATGNLHSTVWTSTPATTIINFGTPEFIPEKYETIQNIDIKELKKRLLKLNLVSDLVKNSWRFLPRDYIKTDDSNPLSLNRLRETFDPSTYSLPLVRSLQATMTVGKQAMQQVSVKRHLKSTLTKKRSSKHRFQWTFDNLKPNVKDNDKKINSINPGWYWFLSVKN